MGLFQRLVQKTGGQAAAPADGAEQVTLSQLIDLLNLGASPEQAERGDLFLPACGC